MLMRRFLYSGLHLLHLHAFDKVLLDRYIQIMRGSNGPLASNNVSVPDSITYHVCDTYLDELQHTFLSPVNSETKPVIPTLDLLAPFMDLAATSTSKQMYDRVMSRVLLPFLETCERYARPSLPAKKRRHEDDEVDGLESLLLHSCVDGSGKAADAQVLRHASWQRLIAAASAPNTYAPSRRKLYALWKEANETDEDEDDEGEGESESDEAE